MYCMPGKPLSTVRSLATGLPGFATLGEVDLSSLHAAFGAIPDPRSTHGRRYDPPFLLGSSRFNARE